MSETPITIELGGQKFVRTPDMKVITLTNPTAADTGGIAMENAGIDYVVPALKVFKILEIRYNCGHTSPYFGHFMDSASADVNTGTKIYSGIFPNTSSFNANVDIDIATTRFINIVGVASTKKHATIVGIEMDA